MKDNKVIIPSREEIIAMLEFAIKSDLITYQNIGEILDMKLIDDLLPKMKVGPQWGYEGFRIFCKENNLLPTDTLAEALKKLK